MARILNVSQSDYRVKVQSGGTITLDVGTGSPTLGTVVITGNLDVKGTTTTVESTVTTIKDNIIQLNYGQTGNGISSTLNYQAGIQIGRGNYSDAKLVFDESVQHYDQASSSNLPGTFVFQFANGTLASIQTSGIAANTSSNLNLDLQDSANVVTLVNTDAASYSARVFAGGPNIIPNKQFINDYITSSNIIIGQADVDRIYKGHGSSPVIVDAEVLTTATNIEFFVRSAGTLNQRAVITSAGLNVDDINSYGNTITSQGLYNLVLASTNTNEVEVNAVLKIDDKGLSPTGVSGATKLYTINSNTTPAPGKTGIFFTNLGNSDELVAKNRALLFSILF